MMIVTTTGRGRATPSWRLLVAFIYIFLISSALGRLQPSEAVRVQCHPTPGGSSGGSSASGSSDSDACAILAKNAYIRKMAGRSFGISTPSAMRKCLESFRFSEDRDLAVMDTVISGLDTFYVYKQIAKDSPSKLLPSKLDVVGKLRRVRQDAVAGKFKTTFSFFRKITAVVQSLNDCHTYFIDNCMQQSSYVGLPVMGVVENGVQKVRVIPVNCKSDRHHYCNAS